MRAAIHVIPAAGLSAEAQLGRNGGSGIATAALQTAERLDAGAGAGTDLVLVAVAAGEGPRLAEQLRALSPLTAAGSRGDE